MELFEREVPDIAGYQKIGLGLQGALQKFIIRRVGLDKVNFLGGQDTMTYFIDLRMEPLDLRLVQIMELVPAEDFPVFFQNFLACAKHDQTGLFVQSHIND